MKRPPAVFTSQKFIARLAELLLENNRILFWRVCIRFIFGLLFHCECSVWSRGVCRSHFQPKEAQQKQLSFFAGQLDLTLVHYRFDTFSARVDRVSKCARVDLTSPHQCWFSTNNIRRETKPRGTCESHRQSGSFSLHPYRVVLPAGSERSGSGRSGSARRSCSSCATPRRRRRRPRHGASRSTRRCSQPCSTCRSSSSRSRPRATRSSRSLSE